MRQVHETVYFLMHAHHVSSSFLNTKHESCAPHSPTTPVFEGSIIRRPPLVRCADVAPIELGPMSPMSSMSPM